MSMNAATARLFRTVVTCIRANGGSTQLSREPKGLVVAGLIVKVSSGLKSGTGGHRARWALTEAGIAKAAEMFPV
jgi:hypothetical protein